MLEIKQADILFIYNTKYPSMQGVTEYCKEIMNKYGCNCYTIHSYSLEELRRDNFMRICATCYEGLFAQGIFTKEDLSWPMMRQRPKYKNIK